MTDPFRVYFDPAEIGADGYPYAWHGKEPVWEWVAPTMPRVRPDGFVVAPFSPVIVGFKDAGRPAIKDLVREQAENRCVRCGHPYRKGEHPTVRVEQPDGTFRNESWSPCDERCTHRGPTRQVTSIGVLATEGDPRTAGQMAAAAATESEFGRIEAFWRVLTVHHLNGVKHDCRWWNLASLCQRCHLTIQSKVYLERPYDRQHSEWFKPYAAGWYAFRYLGLELPRAEVEARLDELLDLELRQEALF